MHQNKQIMIKHLKVGFLISLFSIFILLAGCVENGVIETNKIPEEKKSEIAILTGVENGECMVNDINLWDEPGNLGDGARVKDSITNGCSGIPVLIIKKFEGEDRNYYKIQTYGEIARKEGVKSGWVSELFIVKTSD